MSNFITKWVDGRIKTAVDEARVQMHEELTADLQALETGLTAQITSLPGLLGAQIQNVAVDAGAVAAKVIAGIEGQLQSFNPFGGQR